MQVGDTLRDTWRSTMDWSKQQYQSFQQSISTLGSNLYNVGSSAWNETKIWGSALGTGMSSSLQSWSNQVGSLTSNIYERFGGGLAKGLLNELASNYPRLNQGLGSGLFREVGVVGWAYATFKTGLGIGETWQNPNLTSGQKWGISGLRVGATGVNLAAGTLAGWGTFHALGGLSNPIRSTFGAITAGAFFGGTMATATSSLINDFTNYYIDENRKRGIF